MQLPCKPFATTLSCELVSRWICINTEKAEMAERSRLIDAGNGHAHFRLGGSGSLWHYAFALNSRALCSTRPGREAIMKLAKRFRNPTALQVKQNWQRQGIRLRAPGLGPQCPTTALCFPQTTLHANACGRVFEWNQFGALHPHLSLPEVRCSQFIQKRQTNEMTSLKFASA